VTGNPHNDVLKAIRKMEQAWVNVTQSKFGLRRKAELFDPLKMADVISSEIFYPL